MSCMDGRANPLMDRQVVGGSSRVNLVAIIVVVVVVGIVACSVVYV